jgi:hypothetical protein
MLKGIGFLALALLPPQIWLQATASTHSTTGWLDPTREEIKGPEHHYLDGGEI